LIFQAPPDSIGHNTFFPAVEDGTQQCPFW
jgi:hypothetical protein